MQNTESKRSKSQIIQRQKEQKMRGYSGEKCRGQENETGVYKERVMMKNKDEGRCEREAEEEKKET